MRAFPAALERLTEQFARLPGIGMKSAQRLAFYVLSLPKDDAQSFAQAILDAKDSVRLCPVCQNLTDQELCAICADPERDHGLICVVAEPKDVIAMERAREYHGVYHVLHGVISPLSHVGPDDLRIRELLARVSDGSVREVIMATNPDTEGEATAMYLSRLLRPMGLRVTWPTASPSAVSWNTPTRSRSCAHSKAGRRYNDEKPPVRAVFSGFRLTLLRSGAQGAQKLREQRIAVFFRYLEQAHVRMAPDVAGERGVGFFLHHAEDGNGSVQKRPDARGIALGVPLHAADLVHQNEVAVLRALQRGKPCRLKCIRKRCDAERRMADADAVIDLAEQILRGGGMEIDGPAAVRLRLCRDGAEAAEPLRPQLLQRGGDQRAFPDLHGAGQKYVHAYPSPRGFFAVPERFARCRIISAAIDTAISAGVWPRISSPMGAWIRARSSSGMPFASR